MQNFFIKKKKKKTKPGTYPSLFCSLVLGAPKLQLKPLNS